MTGATVGASFIAGRVISRSSTASDLSEDVSHGTPGDGRLHRAYVCSWPKAEASTAGRRVRLLGGTRHGGDVLATAAYDPLPEIRRDRALRPFLRRPAHRRRSANRTNICSPP